MKTEDSETLTAMTAAQNTLSEHGICTDPAIYLASAINRPLLYATIPCNMFLLL